MKGMAMSSPIIPEPMWGLPSPTVTDEDIYEEEDE
jgi:hypothetical protein